MIKIAKSIRELIKNPDFKDVKLLDVLPLETSELKLDLDNPNLDRYIIKSHFAYDAINNGGRIVLNKQNKNSSSELKLGNNFVYGGYSCSTREKSKEHRVNIDTHLNTISTGFGGAFRSSLNFVKHGNKLRYLTPLECERLMSWPDNHTKYGRKEDGTVFELSDSARYFLCGNGIISKIPRSILSGITQDVSVYSTFAGCDGSCLLLPKNFKKVAFCEYADLPASVLRYHYPDTPIVGDISTAEAQSVKDFDLLITSPPCQPFSDSGAMGCFGDYRGTLFFEALKIIKRHGPKYVLFENVEGLGKRQKGKILRTIVKSFLDEGYLVRINIVRGTQVGIPQNRPRIYIFCTKKS